MNGRGRLHLAVGLVGIALIGAFVASPNSQSEAPEKIEILSLQRQPTAPIPAASRLKGSEPLPLEIQIPRTGLRVLARNSEFALMLYPCRDPRRRYGSELYLQGLLIRVFENGELIGNQRALLEREASQAGNGSVATIMAVVPRRATDVQGPICGQFASLYASRYNELSAAVRVPPPGPADLAPLGITAELIERPAGVEGARFAEEMVRSDAARLGIRVEIWESSEAPIGVRESSPNELRRVIVYYDVGQAAARRGQVCRVLAPNGGLRHALEVITYRQCAMRLGLQPASEPPVGILIGPVSHYVSEQSRWITCPAHGGCPELEAARRKQTNPSDHSARP